MVILNKKLFQKENPITTPMFPINGKNTKDIRVP